MTSVWKDQSSSSAVGSVLLFAAATGFLAAAVLTWQHRTPGAWDSGADVPRYAALLSALAIGLLSFPGENRSDWQRTAVAVPVGLIWLATVGALAWIAADVHLALVTSAGAAALTLLGGCLIWERAVTTPPPDELTNFQSQLSEDDDW